MTDKLIEEAEALLREECLLMLEDYDVDPDIPRNDPEFGDAIKSIAESVLAPAISVLTRARKDLGFWKETASIESMARINLQNDLQETKENNARLMEALLDATAHLAGAASAYRAHAKRHNSQGIARSDPMFSTRAQDFDNAVERARAALAKKEAGDG